MTSARARSPRADSGSYAKRVIPRAILEAPTPDEDETLRLSRRSERERIGSSVVAPEFGLVEGVLAIDPAREAVAELVLLDDAAFGEQLHRAVHGRHRDVRAAG